MSNYILIIPVRIDNANIYVFAGMNNHFVCFKKFYLFLIIFCAKILNWSIPWA